MFADAAPVPDAMQEMPEVVTRISTSGGRHWGINVGRYPSRAGAERQLLRTALAETATLNDGLRKVVERGGEYDANFVGLTQDQADLACRRLQARAVQCFTMGP
jgi:D-alanyl-D-alanine carboxypeptidase